MPSKPTTSPQDDVADREGQAPRVRPTEASPARAAAEPQRQQSEDQRKSTKEFQLELWTRWPRDELWPGVLDLYESAAYLRVSPSSIRRATKVNRAGSARLRHQRVMTAFRIRRADLDALGRVDGF